MKKNKLVNWVLIAFFVFILSLIIIPVIPEVYNLFFGTTVISNHLTKVVGNETNETIIAQKLIEWLQNNTKQPYGNKPYFSGLGLEIYNVSGEPTLFIRTNKASWIIFSKLGNCGEDASYFVELMNKSGIKSRKISVKGEDHAFAEFYDRNNNKYIVDPSAGLSASMFINDTYKWRGEHWSYVEAEDLEGNKEDVTNQYLTNLSRLTINVTGNEFLIRQTQIILSSTYLMYISKIYADPIEIVSYDFTKNNSFSINVGATKNYQLTERVNFYVLSFENKENLDLQKNKSITISMTDLIKIENIRISPLGSCVVIIILLSILFLLRARMQNIK